MRRGWRTGGLACGVGLALLLGCQSLSAAPPCDQFDPAGPASSAQVTLNAGDFTDDHRDEMRSFIATGSLGRVDVSVVSASPAGIVRGISAVPEISRFSPHYGEELRGIAVAVALRGGLGRARVVLRLRQVCAEHFRNTFLYY